MRENDLFEIFEILQNSIFLNEKALFIKKNGILQNFKKFTQIVFSQFLSKSIQRKCVRKLRLENFGKIIFQIMYLQNLYIPHIFEAVWFLKIQNFESSSKVEEVKGNWGRVKIFEIVMIHGVWAFKRTSSHVFATKTHGERLRSSLMIFPYFSMRFGSSTLRKMKVFKSPLQNPKNY